MAPASSEEVSITVSILSQNDDCLFAVKGGGHAPAAGFASINNGITVDMTHLDSVSVNADGTVASVGAGATWLQAYEFLDPLHLTVAGGRNAAVGVGGLTIGGKRPIQFKLLASSSLTIVCFPFNQAEYPTSGPGSDGRVTPSRTLR